MNTIVTVKEGALEGAFSDDKQSVIFKGVPYAAPPVGELRWKRPQPHAKWEGVRPALEFSAKAPQADLSKMGLYGKEFYSDENLKQSEDCLYLNIWTPASAQPGDKQSTGYTRTLRRSVETRTASRQQASLQAA